jgi:hypothetical protein
MRERQDLTGELLAATSLPFIAPFYDAAEAIRTRFFVSRRTLDICVCRRFW